MKINKFGIIALSIVTVSLTIVSIINGIGSEKAGTILFAVTIFGMLITFRYFIPVTISCIIILITLRFVRKKYNKRIFGVISKACKYLCYIIIMTFCFLLFYITILSQFINHGYFEEITKINNADGTRTAFVRSNCGAMCSFGYFRCRIPKDKQVKTRYHLKKYCTKVHPEIEEKIYYYKESYGK